MGPIFKMSKIKELFLRLSIFLGIKRVGWDSLTFRGIPIIIRDDIPPGTIYLINSENMHRVFPIRKDGKPDMRFSINKLERTFLECQKIKK